MARAFQGNYKFVRAGVFARYAPVALLLSIAALAPERAARADTFSRVYFDAATDEIVVTMRYRGTNPNHAFSLRWGQCKAPQGSGPPEVVAEVLDSQAQDAERRDYKTTTRFGLAELPCRPAKVTLRTAPRFLYILVIPAPVAPQH
jgi:hypothetical protein